VILLIDNYDSFVHNLARYLRRLGQQTRVVRNDRIDVEEIRALHPDAIVLSPGPGRPEAAGRSVEIVRAFAGTTPMLGVCLGHQAIAAAFGAGIVRAPQPVHGRATSVFHDGRGVFEGLPSPFEAARYHSLTVSPRGLPAHLRISARTADGVVMAVRHSAWPVVGVQFHPESILTGPGYPILASFLRLAGCGSGPDLEIADARSERGPATS